MKYIIKIINLIVLLGTVAWLGHSPDIAKALGALALLATFLEQERRDHFTLSDWDKNLIKQFQTELPSDSSPVLNLRDHDFANSFWNDSYFTPLDRWNYTWENAEYRFKNKALEKKRCAFKKAIHTLVWDMATETAPSENNPEIQTMNYQDYDNSPKKEEARDRLNKESTDAYKAYCDLMDEIRKKHN